MPEEFTHVDSIAIDAPPAAVYALVSDVTRVGEWSPICTGCEWDAGSEPVPGEGPRVGASFTGHNSVPGRDWSTRSEVVAAAPGREFAWEVNGGLVRWGYLLEAEGAGTVLSETWEFREAGRAFFREKYGERAGAEIAERTRAAREGIPVTLAAIKRIAEQG